MKSELEIQLNSENIGRAVGFGAHATVSSFINKDSLEQKGKLQISSSYVIKKAIRPEFSSYIDREWIVNSFLFDYPNIVRLLKHGKGNDECSFIILPRLDADLLCLARSIGGILSINTTLIVALEMLTGLNSFHSCGMVHCDVKPV